MPTTRNLLRKASNAGRNNRKTSGQRRKTTRIKTPQRIEAIQGPLPDDEDNDDEGGIPQIVKELAPRYPRTILQIFEDKFGKFGTRKRLGSPKDLGSVKRWSNAFIQYISIISDFKEHDIVSANETPSWYSIYEVLSEVGWAVPSALLDFHAQILKLDESYQWEAIVLLALRFQSNLLIETRGPWRLDTGTLRNLTSINTVSLVL
jgi:hypothetical protein